MNASSTDAGESMNDINLRDPKQARAFFRILAQESVQRAKVQITEADELDDVLKSLDTGNAKPAENPSAKPAPAKNSAPNAAATPAPAPTPDIEPGPPSSETKKDYGQDTMKKGLSTVDDLQAKDISLDNIMSKLNTIRAGKSFKDEKVSAQFEEYYNGLSSTERMAMYAFLKGLAQISLGDFDGSQAARPDSSPPGIKMARDGQEATPPVKTGAVEEPTGTRPVGKMAQIEKAPTEEDEEAPIKVGTPGAKAEGIRQRIRKLLNEGI